MSHFWQADHDRPLLDAEAPNWAALDAQRIYSKIFVM
jgi:hypothetical protein